MKQPKCPFLNKPCIEQDCMMWTHITMNNPQSGATEDKWTCSVAMIPLMVLEGARQTRGVQASVDSMRNEVTERQDFLNRAVLAAQNTNSKSVEDASRQQIEDASNRETKPQFER